MNAPDNMYLPDVQASADRRNLAIQRVGVKSLAHPVMVATVRGPVSYTHLTLPTILRV